MLQPRQDQLTIATDTGLFLVASQYGPRLWVAATNTGRIAILLDQWGSLPPFSYLRLGHDRLCTGTWLARVELDLGRANEASRMPGRVGVICVRRHHVFVKCNANGSVADFPLPEFPCCSDDYSTYYEHWSLTARFPSGAKVTLFEAPSEAHWSFSYITGDAVRPQQGNVIWLRPDSYYPGDDADDDGDDDDDADDDD